MQQILLQISISHNIFLYSLQFHSMTATFFALQHAHFKAWKQRLPAMYNAISSPRQFTVCPLLCDHRAMHYANRPICNIPRRSAFLLAIQYLLDW